MQTIMHGHGAGATVLTTEGGDAVVAVVGELDLLSADVLTRAILDARASCRGAVLLNLSRVTFVDSNGVHAILRGAKALRDEGRQLSITKASKVARRVLEIVGIDADCPSR